MLAAAAVLACAAGATAQGWSQPEGLPQEMLASAGAFERFMQDAAGIRADFADGQAVAEAVRRGAAHEPRQLQEGMIAYAAVVALQDAAFVDGVRESAWRYGPGFADAILQDPNMAARIPGAERAAGLVDASLARQGEAVLAAGRAVKQSAYDVQRQAWSKAKVADPAGRLAQAKELSATRAAADQASAARLTQAAVQLGWEEGAGRDGTISAVAAKGLALAALSVMGRAGEAEAPRLQSLVSDGASAQCVRMAKLNLFQCLAVSGPHYEDIYCLGQHALIDTGQCVAKAAASGPAVDPWAGRPQYRQAGLR